MTDLPTIIVDTREQAPYGCSSVSELSEDEICERIRKYSVGLGFKIGFKLNCLDVGDYALASECEPISGRKSLRARFVVERKSVADFISSWCWSKKRMCEVAKLRRATIAGTRVVYVIDGNDQHILTYPYRKRFGGGKVRSATVFYWIDKLRGHGIKVYMNDDKRQAARCAYGLLLGRYAPNASVMPQLSECPSCHGWHGGKGVCYRCKKHSPNASLEARACKTNNGGSGDE